MPTPAMKCLVYDNLDDRREIHRLLERLSPTGRKRFLAWCCQQVTISPNSTIHPRVAQRTRGLAQEIFYDVWALAIQYGLDLDVVAAKLVEVVKRQ